SRQ
ncbi:aldehyde dehydrogenase family protein, partial [Vibrio parahaemolyticus VPTS-2010]